MTSSVWTGSASTSVIWQSGGDATSTVTLVWRNPTATPQGVTVTAQAALAGYGISMEGGPTLPVAAASAVISSYRLASSGYPFVTVNAPTIYNVADVFEVVFQLTVTAFEGVVTEAGAIMVGTVFIG